MPPTNPPLEQQWSSTEQEIARQACDRAREREMAALLAYVRETAGAIASMETLWKLHDFLSARRHDLDSKYAEDQYDAMIFLFARLIKEGWLSLEDLAGLEVSKLTKISALTKLSL
ncbi:hypothetical protein VB712_07845 [Spirulina sp. CCNP1310]|uniref:hypothetical protein n=1 Tax=Spirulina sp. CCNP1310 TaxID=3110249 RepID=UPI002B217859|nr:hypothetical protein [Spirulina sp. CCNP1310]MEA5419139.1 hypothetical protein [Spirulina sp. CCNP1310]